MNIGYRFDLKTHPGNFLILDNRVSTRQQRSYPQKGAWLLSGDCIQKKNNSAEAEAI